MMKNKLLIVFFALFGPVACDTVQEASPTPQRPLSQAGPRDADIAGTCFESCDADFDPEALCQCDASCLDFGDCCSDYEELCESGCTPGEVTDAGDACNTCVCEDDGTWSCTEFACGSDAADCEPGSTGIADDGCNTCVCDDDGTWSCTETACSDQDACLPGTVEDAGDGCNSCFCTLDGAWVCSELAC